MKPTFLKNPKTYNYKECKRFILSNEFVWYRWGNTIEGGSELQKGHDDYPFLSHKFLTRPLDSCLYSQVNSPHALNVSNIFKEICEHNNIKPQVIYRMNANAVYPTEKNLPSPVHVDHEFPHKNLLIYLTDPQGGTTIVEGKEYLAKEDDVILFDGKPHCARPPSKDIRIVLVFTFL